MPWHVLDVGSIWVKEFAASLGKIVPAVNWLPSMRPAGGLENWVRMESFSEPALSVRVFPLQKGYSRFPFSVLTRLGPRQTARMLALSSDATNSPLICTTPFYASVAERWPGPVVYYQTDLTMAYDGVDPVQVQSLDRRLCRVASAVCPNSERIAEYMVATAGCDPAKIAIVPNATRATNIFPQAPQGPELLPPDSRDLKRPVIGVLGNLAANLNWLLLQSTIELTQNCSWLFVGPTNMGIPEPAQFEARRALQAKGGRVRFVGAKPYAELQAYARALDAAVLPYRHKEPTHSGSSTRFYEHLAACRPMIATRGFAELLSKEPLVKLVNNSLEMAGVIRDLERLHFRDGYECERWLASQAGTWDVRAATVVHALGQRSAVKVSLSDTLQKNVERSRSTWSGRTFVKGKFALVSPD